MALDVNSTVWTFKDWGVAIRLVSKSLDCSSPETTPIQVECGQWFSAVLTGSGDVYAWWTSLGTFSTLYWKTRRTGVAPVTDHDAVIPCQTWELKTDLVKLSALPDLPDLPATGLPEEERRKETRLIKIAAGDNFLIGLTNKGHVLQLAGLRQEGHTQIWDYVSKNVYALVPFLKLWCTAAILLRDRQDQGNPILPSNPG